MGPRVRSPQHRGRGWNDGNFGRRHLVDHRRAGGGIHQRCAGVSNILSVTRSARSTIASKKPGSSVRALCSTASSVRAKPKRTAVSSIRSPHSNRNTKLKRWSWSSCTRRPEKITPIDPLQWAAVTADARPSHRGQPAERHELDRQARSPTFTTSGCLCPASRVKRIRKAGSFRRFSGRSSWYS